MIKELILLSRIFRFLRINSSFILSILRTSYNGHYRNTKKISRDHYKQLYANKMDNTEEMNKSLVRYNLSRLN